MCESVCVSLDLFFFYFYPAEKHVTLATRPILFSQPVSMAPGESNDKRSFHDSARSRKRYDKEPLREKNTLASFIRVVSLNSLII